MNEIEVTIRSVQHYLYCPHRWGLIEIEKAWAENYYVTKSNLMHERVHAPESHYSARGKKVYTAVSVYNDLPEYHLFGVTDCIEIDEQNGGFCIVEYKPTKPKGRDYNDADLMQVFAQKVCVDHTFKTDCDAVLYYGDVRKRYSLPLRENFDEYNARLIAQLAEMRAYFRAGIVPPVRKGQKCSGCSMKDMCMPSVKKCGSFFQRLQKLRETERG